jgi:hypothetical protein
VKLMKCLNSVHVFETFEYKTRMLTKTRLPNVTSYSYNALQVLKDKSEYLFPGEFERNTAPSKVLLTITI